ACRASSSRPQAGNPSRPPVDAMTASLNFIRDLEVFTGCSAAQGTMPEFWIGGYKDFLNHVRKEAKVGLVVLFCAEHEDDEEFKRDVICDGELVRSLRENDVLVWGADIRSREGYQVSQTLLTTTYPSLTFVSLLPSPNAANSSSNPQPRLQILTTLSGPPSTTMSTSSILQVISTSILPRTTAFLTRTRRERHTLEEARHLRSEQDKAFQEAERKDREKAQAKVAEQAKLERIASDRRAKEKQQEKQRHWRRYARSHLLPPSQGDIRVWLRTPMSSQRLIRLFDVSPSTLPLFIYAETLLIPPSEGPEDDPASPPADFEPEFPFKIFTSYPRKEIALKEAGGEEDWKVIKEAGGALFAEKCEDSQWCVRELKELHGDSSDEEEVE
ncbi:hypothetical protein P7C73_g6354, partial [Tremellales sp. Uapishka_1]